MARLPAPRPTTAPGDAPASSKASGVDRIWAIEGARAWLAWAVVAGHVAQITGLVYTHKGWHVFSIAATQAVYLFIIISGFVITGLLLARAEPWTAYITRRAFRIFPAYLVALAFAAFAIFLGVRALDFMSWADHPAFRFATTFPRGVESAASVPLAHAALDLTLMQGVVPDQILTRAQSAVLGPAWSLSLEWQFYLIAPVLLWLLLNKRTRVATVLGLFALVALFRLEAFGSFVLPSFLPGSVHLFLIGIASRLGLDLLRDRVPSPAAAALCFVGLAALFREAAALWLWGALLIFITTSEWRDSPLIHRLAGMALESPFARAMGARSYSVYILHYPIMLTAAYFILPLGDFGQFEALALIGAATLLLTLAGSDLMYRFVERPMIRIGARLASAITNKTAARKKTGAALDQTLQARTP